MNADQTREALAAALKANGYRVATHAGIIDALLPTVQRLIADELRTVADMAHREAYTDGRLSWEVLRDRANELDPT